MQPQDTRPNHATYDPRTSAPAWRDVDVTLEEDDTGGSPGPAVGPAYDLAGRDVVTIGRAEVNDITLDDLRVSRRHAQVRRVGADAWEVRDLGSANGTFVNGQRVTVQPLVEGDVLGIGGRRLQLHGGLLRSVGDRRSAWLGAVDLVVSIGERRILDEVGFALEPASVLAVVGPSGSGKSTLLNALTGFRPADSGHVVFEGRDLYANYDDVRLRMGLVPQADILHTQLTVRQALSYAAELRFARDVPEAARKARVDAVMAELNLEERADLRIDRLSGGQRKRVSVGCELLTEPSLLFLDEPTSGLDPGNEVALMESLRQLAHAGRTVVVVTHSVQALDLCDRLLVLAPGGRLAYYGSPDAALAYFGRFDAGATYASMFHALEERRDIDWKAQFRADPGYTAAVAEPLDRVDLAAVPPRPNIDPPPPPTPVVHQLGVLIRRYLAVIAADRGYAATLALQAPIFGLLFALMFRLNVMTTTEALNASVLTWLVVVGATWLGTSNAIREVVKELPLYRRERAIGLSAGAYVMSKVIVLGVITAIQVVILVPIAMLNQDLPPVNDDAMAGMLLGMGIDPSVAQADLATSGVFLPAMLPELLVVGMLVGIASMGLGLLVSSLSGGLDRAATLLPVLLVTQVIVSAPLFQQPEVVLRVAGYLSSSQWGIAAAASTIDLQGVRQPYVLITETARQHRVVRDPTPYERPTWDHAPMAWLTNVGMLILLTVVSLVGAWLAIRRTDPDLMEGRHRGRRPRPDPRPTT